MDNKPKNKKRRRLVGLAASMAAAIFMVWIAWANTALVLTEITVANAKLPAAFAGYRIAHISDLHNAEFGAGNERLLTMLADVEPDLIVITGDLADSRHTDIDAALRFAAGAVAIAPAYYVTGNHEARLADYAELEAGLTHCGVTVLHDEGIELLQEDRSIRLLGLDDPSFSPTGDWLFDDAEANVTARLTALMADETAYTILLSHRPELVAGYAAAGVDLVFSGHAHGGQFRLPFAGGLLAPGQGLFPRYDAGLYAYGATGMSVSRGLGNSVFPFRFNNRPEVVLVTLMRE